MIIRRLSNLDLNGACPPIARRRAEPSLLAHIPVATYAVSAGQPICARGWASISRDSQRRPRVTTPATTRTGDAFDLNAFGADEPTEALVIRKAMIPLLMRALA
jgi:hypothetical protein